MSIKLMKDLRFAELVNSTQAVSEAGKELVNNYRSFVYSNAPSCSVVNAFVNEAKKYKSRHEFDRGSSVAYETSRKNGWLDKFVWLNQQAHPKGYWTYEKCKEEAQKYKSIYEFQKNVPGACDASRRNGWLNEFFPKNSVKND